MSVVSLRTRAYQKTKESKILNHEDTNNIYDVVDEIVNYLLREKAQLIIDIEKGVTRRKELDDIIADYIKTKNIVVNNIESYEKIIDSVNDYLWGYAFVNKYVEELDVSDISVKGLHNTWIKKNGKRELTDIVFPSEQSIVNFAYSVAIKNKGNLSRRDALVVLGDSKTSKNFNLRINIGIDPVNTVSPHIVIRKIPKYTIKPDMDKLEEYNMFNAEIKKYISEAFQKGLNILIVGQGASGKTTLLNAGIELIPEHLSKLAIQEIEELSSGKKNWIWQTVVKKTGESEVEYDLQKLATNGLLLDLDWFIIGESKGAESMALYDASFTGHKIALTSHAPTSKQGIEKVILNMKKSGTDYKREDLLKMLSNMDTVIFMKKFKTCEITEIEGYDEEAKDLIYHPVFRFNTVREEEDGLIGNFERVADSCDRVKKKLSTTIWR